MIINIYSKGNYPSCSLSNFAPHTFDFDGFVKIPSMESFLQSLKFENPDEQQRILYMNAKDAKSVGSTKEWRKYLYWKGQRINRFSREYMMLINKAYASLLSNNNFKQALQDSKPNILVHTIGKTLRKNTVLTWWEFVRILHKLRRDV